jgi:hypothetical protein
MPRRFTAEAAEDAEKVGKASPLESGVSYIRIL